MDFPGARAGRRILAACPGKKAAIIWQSALGKLLRSQGKPL
jgi:hypothetical protein